MTDHSTLFAHTPSPNDPARWHLLVDHLNDVATLASNLCAKFDVADIGRALGIAHDAAKSDPRFQTYLRDCNEGRPGTRCAHSAPGAMAANDSLGFLSLAVIGHHGGIPDASERTAVLENADIDAVAAAQAMIKSLGGLPDIRQTLPEWARERLAYEMLLRMAFSAR